VLFWVVIVLQLALAAATLWLVVLRARVLLLRAPLETATFCEALATALEAGRPQLALQLARACEPAWGAQLARLALAGTKGHGPANGDQGALENLRLEQRRMAFDHLDLLRGLGRMALPLAFFGVIGNLAQAFGASDSLEALRQGAVATRSLGQATATFALGFTTAVFALSAFSLLRARARALERDLERIERMVRDADLRPA